MHLVYNTANKQIYISNEIVTFIYKTDINQAEPDYLTRKNCMHVDLHAFSIWGSHKLFFLIVKVLCRVFDSNLYDSN